MDRSVIEVGGVRLVSAVMVGDMGSIVFPAARSMVEWMKEQESQRPGWIKDKNVFGSLKTQGILFFEYSFSQNSGAELG